MVGIFKDLILPSGLITNCCIIGVIFAVFKKLRRVGILLLGGAGILYAALGSEAISFWLLGSLEYQYPPLCVTESIKNVNVIVVLSGNAWDNPDLPLSGRVNSASALRSIEAMRLFRELPESEILISGGGKVPEIMRNLLISLGVPPHRILTGDGSGNTYENALEVQKKVGSKSIVLVTSAGHMLRAMKVFQKLGMDPIPAPTHYMSRKDYYAVAYLPTPLALEYSDFAAHEYIGILWYRLRNRL